MSSMETHTQETIRTPNSATAPVACSARREHPRKRRNLTRWRMNRLRRLEYEINTGRATERQRLRALHLRLLLPTNFKLRIFN